MLDAYTIRKAIPRLLVAAIAINLSIYFCVALIDVVNVIGHGIGDLIVKPFKTDQAFGGQGIGGTSNNIYGGVFWVLTILSGVGIWKIFKGVKGAASKDTSLGAGQFLLTKGAIILIPFILFIILISLAVVFTLVLRQGLIIFLAVISPVAFALFVLPGTEKYFKKWLDLFFSTLMVYPIVAVLFAVSSALTSVLVGNANAAGGLPGVTSALAAVVVAFAPLVMIPFAFKIAGGVLGAIMNSAGGKAGGLVSRTRKGLQNTGQDPTSFLGSKIFDYKSNVADARANLYNQTRNAGSVRRSFGGLVGGKYSANKQAKYNKMAAEMMQETSESGNDIYDRASIVDTGALQGTARHEVRNGINHYRLSTGQWVDEGTVAAGKKRNPTAGKQLAAHRLVMSKSGNVPPEFQDDILEDYLNFANATGMDAGHAVGNWAGIAIPNQRMRADLRHTGIERDQTTGRLVARRNHAGLLDAMGTDQGFSLATQQEGTFEALSESYRAQHVEYQTAIQSGNNVEATRIADRMDNARGNLAKFVGTTGPSAPQPDADGTMQSGSAFGGASSASHKSEQAARRALAEIMQFDQANGPGGTNPPARPYSGGGDGDRPRPGDA